MLGLALPAKPSQQIIRSSSEQLSRIRRRCHRARGEGHDLGALFCGEALGEALQVDHAPSMRPVAHLADPVMRLDREDDAPARDSTTRAVAVTVRPTGVGARWRTSISLPTVAQPVGKEVATAAAEAISIARIIIGVLKTNGIRPDARQQ